MDRNAVVLLSGGSDSTTTLAIAKSEGYACNALSFRYGQRHQFELEAAKRMARLLGAAEHRTIGVSLAEFGGSALTDRQIAVPKDRNEADMLNIPPTYMPARNTIFLSYAVAWADTIAADAIFIGVNSLDYSG